MGFLIEVFWALLMVGAPIAIFTLAIFWWALDRGHFKESLDTKALDRELKAMTKSNKKNKKNKSPDAEKLHPVLDKWGKFGGGFYGIVAFFTYIIIEIREIIDMITNLGGFMDFLRQLDVDLIINMIIAAFTNFIAAITWPLYWLRRIDTEQNWIWFVMAYAGYWVGKKAAQLLIQHRAAARM